MTGSDVTPQQARPLTAEAGEFHVDPALREVLCYLDDGRLLIAKSHLFNVNVRAFRMRLDRLGRKHQVQPVEMSEIAQVYREARRASVASVSEMQAAALAVFQRAVALRASDIHLRVARERAARLYFRIHNDLEFIEEWSYEYGAQLCTTIYQAMTDVSDATFETLSRQDARISERAKLPPGLDGIRIATSPQVGGHVMVLRLLYNDAVGGEGLAGLGYGAQQRAALELMARRPSGINVIGGPTGSGKSTTLQRLLAGLIREMQGRRNVITVEDPPEYPIGEAVQTPVTNAEEEEARSRAFQLAIKASMRLDPDIIMIGEVRDTPSARLAVQASMTGHQVWSTVHATSAFAILDRLIDLGVPVQLATDPTVITGLVCQRLVKVLCAHCKRPLREALKNYSEEDVRRVLGVLALDRVNVRGEGCEHCRGSGTAGRTVVAEAMVAEPELMAHWKRDERDKALALWRGNQGGVTMLEDAIAKIASGEIDPFQAEEIVGPLDWGVGARG